MIYSGEFVDIPFTGERFEELRGDYLRMEIMGISQHTVSGVCVVKLNGISKWLPRAWIQITAAPRGGKYLLVRYPKWVD